MKTGFPLLCKCALFSILLLGHTSGIFADQIVLSIAADTIKAWEQSGAKAGWLRLSPTGQLTFEISLEQSTIRLEKTWEGLCRKTLGVKPIPAFQFLDWKTVDLQKLPSPDVPFGLSVPTPPAEDGLQTLATFEHLIYLKVDGKIVD